MADCRAHRKAIVAWLNEGHQRWGWTEKLAAALKAATCGLAFRLSLTDPMGSLGDEPVRVAEGRH